MPVVKPIQQEQWLDLVKETQTLKEAAAKVEASLRDHTISLWIVTDIGYWILAAERVCPGTWSRLKKRIEKRITE